MIPSPARRPSSSRHAARVPRTDRTDRAALHAPRPVSAGVAQRCPGDTAAQLMRRADLALYRVKAAGRGAAALHSDDSSAAAAPR